MNKRTQTLASPTIADIAGHMYIWDQDGATSVRRRSENANDMLPKDFPYKITRHFALINALLWCDENIRGEWYYHSMYFHFQKQEDATLFTLFWKK